MITLRELKDEIDRLALDKANLNLPVVVFEGVSFRYQHLKHLPEVCDYDAKFDDVNFRKDIDKVNGVFLGNHWRMEE